MEEGSRSQSSTRGAGELLSFPCCGPRGRIRENRLRDLHLAQDKAFASADIFLKKNSTLYFFLSLVLTNFAVAI